MSEPAGVPEEGARRRIAIRAPQDFVAGVALMVLALLAFWGSAELGEGQPRFFAVGPTLLPRMVATLILLIGAGLTIGSLLREGEAHARWTWRGPLFVFLGVIGFALSIRTVGLAVAGPLVALVSGAATPETRVRELVIFAVLMTAFSVGLFRYVLHLPIPILIIPGVIVI